MASSEPTVYVRNRVPVPHPHEHLCCECQQPWACEKDPCYTSPRVPAGFVRCDPCIQRLAAEFAAMPLPGEEAAGVEGG